MGKNPNAHDVQLTATRNGNRITVAGAGGANLPRGSGAHLFNFTLVDNSGLNVRFGTLDTEDNSQACPPAAGENSQQIVGVVTNNNGQPPRTARFTDNNNNSGGAMNVCYQWNFTCDDPNVAVEPFDPIIINGGV